MTFGSKLFSLWRQRLPIYRDLVATRSLLDAAHSDVARYRHAFETTALDRDRLQHDLHTLDADAKALTADYAALTRQHAQLKLQHTELAEKIEAARVDAERRDRDYHVLSEDCMSLRKMVDQIADPLDAGFFRLDFPQFRCGGSEKGRELARRCTKMFDEGAYSDLVWTVIREIPVRIAQVVEPDYFRPFASYYIASLYAALGDHETAQRYAESVEFDAPPDGADFLPYDLRQAGRLQFYQQSLANNSAGLIVVSLPRSASALLTGALSHALGVPILRLSLGEGLRSVVVPRWARQVCRGGATTHEHIAASPENLAALRDAGLKRLWLQVRDPRDAAFSTLLMNRPVGEGNPGKLDPDRFLRLVARYAQWLDGWFVTEQNGELDVRVVTFEEVTHRFMSTLRRMLDGHYTSQVDERAQRYIGSARSTNFRRGVGQEWVARFPAETCQRAWDTIPERVRDRIGLKLIVPV